MNTQESYRRFRDTYGDVASSFATGRQEEQSTYYSDLQQLGAKAQNELRQVYNNYFQELEAASFGDDSVQRATVAYSTAQREYGRIQTQYFRECQLRQERMRDTVNALTCKSSVKALDSWIEYLRELRQNLAQEESEPNGKNKS